MSPIGATACPAPAPGAQAGTCVPDADAKRFHEQGFLVLPDLCSEAECRHLRVLLMRLFEHHMGHDEGNQFDMLGPDLAGLDRIQPQILKPSLYAPQLLLTPYFHRVQALARRLLGDDGQFSFDHSIVKRAGTAIATPWHQDEAHHRDPHFQFEQVSFWLPLQDVGEHNGCMCYLPGSNRGPLLPHRSLHGDARIHALECEPSAFDAAAAIAMPVRAGTCIAHDGRTLHAALPNRSGADRLAYVLSFRGAARPRTDATRFPWLDAQHTEDIARHRRWRRHGGYLVLALRWLQRAVSADGGKLRRQPQRFMQCLAGLWRQRRGVRG